MEVLARGGERLVAEGIFDEVHRCAAVEGMRGMGVAQPVRRDRLLQPGTAGGAPDDLPDPHRSEVAAPSALLPGGKDRIPVSGARSKPDELAPGRGRESDGAGLASPLPKTVICPLSPCGRTSPHFRAQSSLTRTPVLYRSLSITRFRASGSSARMVKTSGSSRIPSASVILTLGLRSAAPALNLR
jgi:hypothetical protein